MGGGELPVERIACDRGSVQVRLLACQNEIEALLSVFEEIAREQNWQAGDQLRANVPRSVHFAIEIAGQLAGGIQLVSGSRNEPLPCLAVWPELELEGRTDVAEIALLALRKEYRGQQRLFWPLCVEVWRFCRQHGITELWAEVTPANLRVYRRFGWPFEVRGPLRTHWGEECYPCCLRIEEAETAFRQAAQRSLWRRALVRQAEREETSPALVTIVMDVLRGTG